MAEEKVLVTGEKPDDQKLGKSATFVGEGQGDYTIAFGVPFKKGEAVNLEELLGPEQAQRAVKKLANNPNFEVEGGKKVQERRGDQDKLAALQAASGPVLQAQNRALAEGREPPEDYDAPLQAVLEKPAARQQQQEPPSSGDDSGARRAPTPRGR